MEELENICKAYDLPVFQNPRDNFLMIIQSNKPSSDDKFEALELYERYLIAEYTEDVFGG